jgi:hypothetical protein
VSGRILAKDIAYIRSGHKRNRVGNCTNDRDRWPCETLLMANEIAVLRAELEWERHVQRCPALCAMSPRMPVCPTGRQIQERLTAAREAEAAVPS